MKNKYTQLLSKWLLLGSALLLSYSLVAQSGGYLIRPLYNCQTGLITFLYNASDGTPITYSANGVTLSSPSSNTGIVSPAFRASTIIIRATQSGTTTEYAFNIPGYCAEATKNGPNLRKPIPDTVLTLNQSTIYLDLASYFFVPQEAVNYRSYLTVAATGLPPGLTLNTKVGTPPGSGFPDPAYAILQGTPTAAGTYTITIQVQSGSGIGGPTYVTSTTFTITVRSTDPPTGKPLSITAPAYNCTTGALKFTVSGGDGMPIEYMAAGVTDWTTNPNQVVSAELRQRSAQETVNLSLMARQSGVIVKYGFNLSMACQGTPLELTASYSCESGIVSFRIKEGTGNGSPITYYSAELVNMISFSYGDDGLGLPSHGGSGTIGPELLANPKAVTILASQEGYAPNSTYVARYTFSFIEACLPRLLSTPSDITYVPRIGDSFFYDIGNLFEEPLQGRPGAVAYTVIGLPGSLSLVYGPPSSGGQKVNAYITGAPTVSGVYTVTATATNIKAFGSPSVSTTFTITISPITSSSSLALTAPVYDCASGAIMFKTSGGDNTSIEYMAVGVTPWTTNPAQTIDAAKRADRNSGTVIQLMARQSGVVVSYDFDYAYCPVSTTTTPGGGLLALTAPTYNCTTGAFTFNATGGDGTLIEYMAIGITAWTTNPAQFVDKESRTTDDVQPFVLRARQSDVVTTLVWNLKSACGRARLGATELKTPLRVLVLGNPVNGQTALVEIRGVEGQRINVELLDVNGRPVHQQQIPQAGAIERVDVPVGSVSGLLLLQVDTPTQRQQIKLIKN